MILPTGRPVRLIPAHTGQTSTSLQSPGSREAHPRSRGENIVQFAEQAVNAGSSPLTRGKRVPRGARQGPLRLIPAHTGKTEIPARSDPYGRAHPRSRGENLTERELVVPTLGSSPLTRGKRECVDVEPRVGGLIPAHSGKTHQRYAATPQTRAHPHSRGENSTLTVGSIDDGGSSPLTRGKRPARLTGRPVPGLIPAHAGKNFTS